MFNNNNKKNPNKQFYSFHTSESNTTISIYKNYYYENEKTKCFLRTK